MAKETVFYSWQSDLPNSLNRGFIEDCLERAAKNIRTDESIQIDPVIDRDTAGVPGSPDIAATIFVKIERSSVFVADVSIIRSPEDGRPCPNPNVLVELGYAIKALGWEQIILVMNTHFGSHEYLPFDLRQRRVLGYRLEPVSDDKPTQRKTLVGLVEKQLELALSVATMESEETTAVNPASLDLDYEEVSVNEPRVHRYIFKPFVTNNGDEPLGAFHVDIEFPRSVMPESKYGAEVEDRSTHSHRFLRFKNVEARPVFPGDKKQMAKIRYFVDGDIFRSDTLSLPVKVALWVPGFKPVFVEKPIREFQRY